MLSFLPVHEDLLLAWPDALPCADGLAGDPIAQAACLIRQHQHRAAELLILEQIAICGQQASDTRCTLLALLAHSRVVREAGLLALHVILQELSRLMIDGPFVRYLQVQAYLLAGDGVALAQLPAAYWCVEGPGSRFLRLAQVAYWLRSGQQELAAKALNDVALADTLEGMRLRARLLSSQYRFLQSVELLEGVLQRAPDYLPLQVQYLKSIFDARDGSRASPALKQAVERHAEHPALLSSITALQLLRRQPGLARRSALLASVAASVSTSEMCLSNQLICYEHSGHTDWMPYVIPHLVDGPSSHYDLHGNLILQLASCESERVRPQLENVVGFLQSLPLESRISLSVASSNASRPPYRPLRVAWLTPDLNNHPVARFLLSFFSAAQQSLAHEHHVVSLLDGGEHSWMNRFERIPDLQLHDFSHIPDHQRIGPARDLQSDIAIDLSGWTANHFMPGFLARIAPLQITYLGYFATTGLPTMDVWLGDQHLFPDPVHEWHTEQIHRLARCFIAWQPSSELPEANAEVPDAPPGPVRFGSFNHLRKISDDTLRLWGTLLNGLPEAQLVLKAHAQDDAATQELLRRRLHRAGIDPQAILWLPFAATPEEHLQQYRHIDIALDPFPNGGCTTTCEALWMGVPTVALAGRHYVSRMSTAVLHGAGLADWVAPTPQAYVDLARERAASLQQLRSQRGDWRRQLQASPLGDAADLMQHLEQAFSLLYAQQVSRSAASG